MKKLTLSALFAATLLFSAGNIATAQTKNAVAVKNTKAAKGAAYQVDATKSQLTWNGKKVTGEHTGTINVANGQILVAGNKVTGGTFDIDMTSIKNTDLTDPEYNGKLIGHLKSDDFFSVEKNPKATFKITSLTPIKGAKAGQPNYTVKGNLTIKGITNAVSFPAAVAVNNGTATAKGVATLDRTKWDIRYGSKSFFANIGDKAINDDFTLDFNIVAKQDDLARL
jgi:polyisoprenoid-binding protein YceI